MNKVFIILAVIIGIFFLSQLIMSFQSDKIETPKYTVLKKYDEFEIRQYDTMIIAQTILPSSSYDASSSMGFRRVASYIFGGNDKNESISMTSPVFMEMGENTKMAFVMPKNYKLEALPKPNSGDVQLIVIEPKKYAVIKFSGYASDEKIKEKSQELQNLISREKLTKVGTFQYLGYNPPWKVIGRKNEIAVEINY
jgi:hypothetical protein